MTRLTKTVRQNVAHAMIKAKFEPALEPLAERAAELFNRVYESVYDAEKRKLMARLEKLHRTSFQHKNSITTNCGGMRIFVGEQRLGSNGVYKRVEVAPRPFAYHDGSEAFTFVDCPLALDLCAFAQAHEAFKAEVGQARTKLDGALSSVTTIRQVEENWPEALPFFAREIPTPGNIKNLPAVRFEELTQFFGLKAGEEGQ